MEHFNAEDYKKRLAASLSCETCEKVPLPLLNADDRYIFISYAHKDYRQVYSDLVELYESDIPFWYDSGLPAGINWDDVVREKMNDPRCAGVIFYISESLFLSRPIQTEIRIARGEDGGTTVPRPPLPYFSVNLSGAAPSVILKNVYATKTFPDAEDTMTAQLEWVDSLTKAFPDKATFLPFDHPRHRENLVEQIGVRFGISPNYNPYRFGEAVFRTGTGQIAFPNGSVYEGTFRNNLFHGQGTMTYADGSVYRGDWRDGAEWGQGTISRSDGTVYEGAWKDGKPCGRGTLTLPGGTVYTGECRDFAPSGQGTATFHNGLVYTGEWKYWVPHGRGTLSFPQRVTYEGRWNEGWPLGAVKMTYADGDVYEGAVKELVPHGQGTMTFRTGAVYRGDWVEGQQHGQGIMLFPNGDVYEGTWQNGRWNGQGTMTFRTGAVYTGEWRDDAPNGRGTLTLPDGNVQTGVFRNGTFIGSDG